jgi:hypothetical protein
MKKGHKKDHKSTIRLLEEGLHLLRSTPGDLLGGYYLGSVPFILGLLYFWADMSRSANANEYSAVFALGLAFLFAWMKFWQAVFALRVRYRIVGDTQYQWTFHRITSVAATQTLIQSTRFIVLPMAALVVLPFGFCYAFYHNTTAFFEKEIQRPIVTCKWAWRQAGLWPRQNHLLIGIFWIFGAVILMNVSIAAFLVPQLVKTLFGIDSVFALSGVHLLFNSTFWVAMLGMTYLFLDPLIKTAYVLRCFYGSALMSGDDLRTQLKRIAAGSKKMVAGLFIVFLCAVPLFSAADQRAPISAGDLDRSIEEIMGRKEFAWRMPRENTRQEEQETKGTLGTAVKWLLDMLAGGIKTLGKWVAIFIDWLETLLPEHDKKPTASNANWTTPVRIALILLLLLLVGMMIFIFLRIRRRYGSGVADTVDTVAVPVPDLTEEEVKADDLPAQRWLSLAQDLAQKGELRLAMRALYLATLAHLAENRLITIEIYKSNREYEKELGRRAHMRKELLSVFSESLHLFEGVWYGMHRIARSDLDEFAANQKRMMAFAEK